MASFHRGERISLMINHYRPGALLVQFGAAVLAAALLALVGASPAWAEWWGFGDAQNYPVGESPLVVTSADFNGDGEKDLATVNYGNYADATFPRPEILGGVSVLLGKGDGTFQPKQEFEITTNPHPRSVTSAHFNGDVFADLVVPNPTSDNVAVFLSNGDGTFQDPQNFAAGDGPLYATSADFNGDVNADLAVPNRTSDDVSILLGNGDGTFQAAKSFPAGDAPYSAINTDFNADGNADLAVLRQSSDALTVLLGNGDGTFQEAKNLPVEDETYLITSADFDGDNKADLVTVHHPSFGSATTSPPEGVSVLLGNGDGTFQDAKSFPVSWDTSYRRNPEQVISADFNGDKKQDLATSNRGGFFTGYHGASVLLGNGDGTFQEAEEYPFGINPSSLTAADFDADGFPNLPDLAVADDGSNDLNFETSPDDVSVLWNQGGTLDFAPTVTSVSPLVAAKGVSPTANGEATFSDDMSGDTLTTDTFTLTPQGSSTPVAATVSYDPTIRKATLDPRLGLEVNTTYTATIKGGTSGAKNVAGNALEQDHSWSFTTALPPDTTAPRVDTVSPGNLTTGVGRSTDATATFSEKMAPASITTSTFKLFKCSSTTSTNCATQITNVAVSLSTTDALKATLNPYRTTSTLLASKTKYKAVVTTGAKDVAGNALDQDPSAVGNQQKVWYFTTGRG